MQTPTLRTTLIVFALLLPVFNNTANAQKPDTAAERGSITAKNGFRNEDQIRDKFNRWKTDKDARAWLKAMGYKLGTLKNVVATKPHGQKADVQLKLTTTSGEAVEGISIKLVSSENGFNQVDKRWLKSYATMWKMPPDVIQAMKLYLGEDPPTGRSRRPDRMYLNELRDAERTAVIEFFTENKEGIVSDLLAGDGKHAADWFMVTLKNTESPRWTIRSMSETVSFFSEGPVVMTRYGNLKIGRVSMQRKGGDNGRETAKMLQFKINPALVFDAK